MTDPTGRPAHGDPHPHERNRADNPVEAGIDVEDSLPASVRTADPVESEKEVSLSRAAWNELRRNPLFLVAAAVVLLMIIIAIAPQLFAPDRPAGNNCLLANSRLPPRAGAIFGNDRLGCDVYSYVIWGARPSITIGLVVTIATVVIGVLLGSLAGFFGGLVDALLSRLTDIMFGFPFLVGAIVILSAFPDRTVWTVALVLTVFGWAGLTRIMRSSVFSAKSMDYVQAARALGATNTRILYTHILPNAVTPVIVLATIGVGGVIGAEATLTFLGVGLQAPTQSWGLAISNSQREFLQAPHMLLFPSLFLSITVLAFIVLGDAVRDAFDPKLR